ncbi:uncharacterized protein LOC144558160 [Carex rostrata]
MARGRIPRLPRESVPDEVRRTPTTRKAGSSFQRRLLGGTILSKYHTQSRFQFRLTKARAGLKPLQFLLRPTKPRSQVKPLHCYKRRKTLLLNPGAGRDSLSPGVFGASTAPIQGSSDTANQNPSSVVEDLVPANAGTKEGTPNSEASVSATENYNADPNPNPNSSPNGFQKTASIWQAVEKLKVFSQAPQRPHFTKLQSLCPEMREGIALGLMVTYANLTDSIKNLSYDDDVALIMEKISCLNPLEENGFDMGQYRARLRQLLYIKTEYTDSESQISRLEVQLAEKETKLASLKKVQLEMGDVSREINLAKERINFLMVKRDRLLDLTVGNGHEISRLKEEISNLRLNESARQEFASLLVKPL